MGEQNEFFRNLGINHDLKYFKNNHFNFSEGNRIIMLIGGMGAGKTEYSAKICRDSKILLKKSNVVKEDFSYGEFDRRKVFYVKNFLDSSRFTKDGDNALSYRGGFEMMDENRIGVAKDSSDIKEIFEKDSECGTFIIDEPGFYDERIVYMSLEEMKKRRGIFVFPTLSLNFRRELFNKTVSILLEYVSEIILLGAYCEHEDCFESAYYSYRFYKMENLEVPALYFDPVIIVGGVSDAISEYNPTYETRCEKHHYIFGKEYIFSKIKPMLRFDRNSFSKELSLIKENSLKSELYALFNRDFKELNQAEQNRFTQSIKLPHTAEKLLCYSYLELNAIDYKSFNDLIIELQLDEEYIKTLIAR